MAANINGHRKLEDHWMELKKGGKIGTGSSTQGL
jgi:hypothetical protein